MIPLHVRVANFIDSVSFVADKKRQQAVWIDGVKGVSSITTLGELYAQFFDDNDIDNFVNDELDNCSLSPEQCSAIRRFRDALNNFSKAPGKLSQQTCEKDLVNDYEWNELVTLAQTTLGAFDKQVKN